MLKSEIINNTYSRIRISGLTIDPAPEHVTLALNRLEGMMAEMSARSICVGYNFQEVPDPDDELGVELRFHDFVETNLAVRLIPDFNKEVSPILLSLATATLSMASGYSASQLIREVQPSRRMARGSGNTLRYNRWQRFARPIDTQDQSCENNKMVVGEVNDFTETFHAYLRGDTISSFTIVASQGLSIISSSSLDDIVSFRIKADDLSTSGSRQNVIITITTTDGRITTKEVPFELRATS